MIITGICMLATSLTFLVIGTAQGTFRPLLGAAILAVGGSAFLAVGTVLAYQVRRREQVATAGPGAPAGSGAPVAVVAPPVAAGTVTVTPPGAVAGVPAGYLAETPPGMTPVVIYVPTGTVAPPPAGAAAPPEDRNGPPGQGDRR